MVMPYGDDSWLWLMVFFPLPIMFPPEGDIGYVSGVVHNLKAVSFIHSFHVIHFDMLTKEIFSFSSGK